MRRLLRVRGRPWRAFGTGGSSLPGPGVAVAAGFLLAGLLAGTLAVGGIGERARADVAAWLVQAIRAPDGAPATLERALLLHGLTLGLLWLGGLTSAGLFLVPGALLFRGFSLGFAVGFLVYEGGWPGLAVVLGSLAPPYLVAVPAWLAVGAASLAAAWRISAARLSGRSLGAREVVGPALLRLPVAGAAALLASGLDAYLAPLALRALVRALGI